VPNKCLNEPPKHTDHESLVIVYIDNAKFLEAISNKKRSDNSGIQILQYGSHPTKKIQFHTTAVVDSIPVPPSFIEVDHNFRNTVFGQSLKRLV